MIRWASAVARLCVVSWVFVALVATSFAHRIAQPEMSPELAAYVAAGGSIADICGTVDENGNVVGVDCEACRVSDHLSGLPTCQQRLLSVTDRVLTFRFVAKRIAKGQPLDPARLTRAPPQT